MSGVEVDLSGCKVLIVDDVPANIDVLVQALDSEGYNVLVASDGEMALDVASYSRPDVILLDVMMPGIDGYETCRRLKGEETLAAVPVIFLTARDDLGGIVEGFAAGGLDDVTKGLFPSLNQPLHLGVTVSVAGKPFPLRCRVHARCRGRRRASAGARSGRPVRADDRIAAPWNPNCAG